MESEPVVTTCYRHPSVECHVRCTRCERYICPDCMREAPVGHQCPECVKEGARSVRRARTIVGGRISATPVVTYALIALNALVYVAEVVRPGIVDRFSVLTARLAGPDGLHYVYQADRPAGFRAEGVVAGEWERLLTGGFLHLQPTEGTFGLLHIVMNMVALWQLGRVVEPMLGRVRFAALYLLAVLGGSVCVVLLADPGQGTVGASGGVFGLGAAYYVLARRVGADLGPVNRFMAYLLVWLLLSAGLTSWQGHVGGLVTGGLVAAAFAHAPRDGRRVPVQAGACAVLLVVLAAAVLARVSALTGGGPA
ncbi:rhomboid family intramembrane serine protease [Streptomyces griseoviridis]|uniref:Rhomboid family intramembrane serine protease n=2 Tax=Streptomyces TaxID=1883 RepID=A0A918L9F1_STRGD|nr:MULTISPECIES: rhomboid family intramembrane serine protease [Streptomyces]GGS22585.1 rhomboid family intramembrane serine protease [Streptomyces niveoruber]GGU70525.1 rhomboid family intramembrane serine protease [Streptomyces daghestanicus]GHI34789.1 rhomboid family intramembrane serine protease [Streptomyces daghestanicus]